MKTATFDNPQTWHREGWQDGELVFSYSAQLIMSKHWPPPPSLLHIGANVGEWNGGQLLGDAEALQAIKEPEL